MNPFAESQVRSLVESIRLLEVLVTAPLGLYSDLKMLRGAINDPAAQDLTAGETRDRRLALLPLASQGRQIALRTIALVRESLAALDELGLTDGLPFGADWPDRASRVLDRAERQVGSELRTATAARVRGLYVIVDPEVTRGRPVAQIAEAAVRGGARMIQLRDKTSDAADVLRTARELKHLCEPHALFVLNDDAGLTAAAEAHGLHTGQTDLPVAEARRILGAGQIIGRSNNSIEEVVESQSAGADYIAVGAVFPTATMAKAERRTIGTETIARVKEMVDQPVVAIGGINLGNVASVFEAGADAACVASAVALADEPEQAAAAIVEAIAGVSPAGSG